MEVIGLNTFQSKWDAFLVSGAVVLAHNWWESWLKACIPPPQHTHTQTQTLEGSIIAKESNKERDGGRGKGDSFLYHRGVHAQGLYSDHKQVHGVGGDQDISHHACQKKKKEKKKNKLNTSGTMVIWIHSGTWCIHSHTVIAFSWLSLLKRSAGDPGSGGSAMHPMRVGCGGGLDLNTQPLCALGRWMKNSRESTVHWCLLIHSFRRLTLALSLF